MRILFVAQGVTKPRGGTHVTWGILNSYVKSGDKKRFEIILYDITNDRMHAKYSARLFLTLFQSTSIYWLSNIPITMLRGPFTTTDAVILKLKPDVIFTLVYDLAIIRAAKKIGAKVIFYDIDTPMILTWNTRLILVKFLKGTALTLTYSKGTAELFSNLGIKAEFMPLAFDERLLHFVKQTKNKEYDLSFVGNFFYDRMEGFARFIYPLIKAGFDVKIFGERYPRFLKTEGPVPYTKVPEIVAKTRINLNIHRDPARRFLLAVNLRVFEILGSGGFLLTDHFKGVEEMFIVGEELETGKSGKEFISKAKYYLENEEEREYIAKKGQKKVLRNHTWTIRWKFLREIFESVVRW